MGGVSARRSPTRPSRAAATAPGVCMDGLIDLIYETIADPEAWSTVASRMSDQLGAQSFRMFWV